MELQKISDGEFQEVLIQHELWLSSKETLGQRADLSNLNLENINFENVDLSGAILQSTSFRGANLQNTCFSGVKAKNANFSKANLSSAELIYADLEGANFQGADLKSADLRQVNLQNANLQDTNLRGANLRGANLRNADFHNAIIEKEDLTESHYGDAIGLNIDQPIESQLRLNLAQYEQKIQELNHQLKSASEDQVAQSQIQRQLDEAKEKQSNSQIRLNSIQQENDDLKKKLETELSSQIQSAIEALKTALTNTDEQISLQKTSAMELRKLARSGLLAAVLTVLLIPFVLLPVVEYINPYFLKTSTAYFGKLSIIFYTFPVIVLLLASTALLRHEQKIMAEIRHFSDQKHAIELYAGLLKAAQHAAANIKDPERAEKYVEETFSMIRKKILDGKDEDTKLDPVAQADQDKQILGTARDTLRLVSDVARLVKMTKSS